MLIPRVFYWKVAPSDEWVDRQMISLKCRPHIQWLIKMGVSPLRDDPRLNGIIERGKSIVREHLQEWQLP